MPSVPGRRKSGAYNWQKSAWKAIKSVGALVGIAVCTAMASPDVAKVLEELPAAALAIPIVQAIAVYALDWLKHRTS